MSEEQLPSAPSRRYAVIGVKIAVSAALLTLLFSRIDVDRLWAGARSASLTWPKRRRRQRDPATPRYRNRMSL